ncbi:MAG: hypothetical protein U5K37_13220 [Natrialbaceae archaeon]|nr:hypothetical protein [Natrialbaceae archaeon]
MGVRLSTSAGSSKPPPVSGSDTDRGTASAPDDSFVGVRRLLDRFVLALVHVDVRLLCLPGFLEFGCMDGGSIG